MKLVAKLFLTLLSVAGLVGILWLSLPWLLVSFATQQLEVRGYSNIEFGDARIGLQHAELESLRLSSDSMDIAADNIVVTYKLPRLLSASMESISIDSMDIVSKTSRSSSTPPPDIAWLAGLLTTPWYNYLPADRIAIHQATLSDEANDRSTHASLKLTRAEQTLHARVDLGSQDTRSHSLTARLSSDGRLEVRLQGEGPDATSPLLLTTEPGGQPGNIIVRYTADLNKLASVFPLLANDMKGQLDGEIALIDSVNTGSETLFSIKSKLQDGAIGTYSATHIDVAANGSMMATDNLLKLTISKTSHGNAKELNLSGLTIEKTALSLPHELRISDREISLQSGTETATRLSSIRHGNVFIPEASLSRMLITMNRPTATKMQSVKGSFLLVASELKNNDVVITASPIDIALQIPGSDSSPLKLDATTESVVVNTAEATVEFNQCSMSLWLPDNRATADMLCQLNYPSTPVNAHLEYRFIDETGTVTFNTGKATPTAEQPLFATALNSWDEPYDLVSGDISASGKYNWGPGSETLTMNLWLEDAGGFYEEVLFSGMEYEAQLQLLPEIHSLKPTTLNIDIIDIGIPVTDTRATINLKTSRHGSLPLTITNKLRMNLLEGRVTGNGIKYDLNTVNNDFILDINGLDLAAVVDMQQVEGLQATGLMDGQIPVQVDKNGLYVKNGELNARAPGGRIQYSPEGGTQEMEQAAPGTNIVFDILKDLNYHTLDTGVSYSPDGDLALSLAIKGKSPKLDKKRPVHFNLNLEQNVLQLLRSLRIAEDIDSVLDKNVQQYFRNQR